MMSWYNEMVAARRSKSLTTGNVQCGVAAVHEVLGSLALETLVNCHAELMEDSLRNIEPVQLVALVKLPSHSALWLQRAVVTVHCDYCAQWSQCTVVAAHSGHSAL